MFCDITCADLILLWRRFKRSPIGGYRKAKPRCSRNNAHIVRSRFDGLALLSRFDGLAGIMPSLFDERDAGDGITGTKRSLFHIHGLRCWLRRSHSVVAQM
jgi:hypothetical protein